MVNARRILHLSQEWFLFSSCVTVSSRVVAIKFPFKNDVHDKNVGEKTRSDCKKNEIKVGKRQLKEKKMN